MEYVKIITVLDMGLRETGNKTLHPGGERQ